MTQFFIQKKYGYKQQNSAYEKLLSKSQNLKAVYGSLILPDQMFISLPFYTVSSAVKMTKLQNYWSSLNTRSNLYEFTLLISYFSWLITGNCTIDISDREPWWQKVYSLKNMSEFYIDLPLLGYVDEINKLK